MSERGGVPLMDFSGIGDIGKTYNDAQDRATLQNLGAVLSDPNTDYRKAAGIAAKAGRFDIAMPLLQRAAQRDAVTEGNNALNDVFLGQGGGPKPPASPGLATSATDTSQPRGIRNNNPLNIEAGGFTQSQPGYSGTDGRFARFETPEHGITAASNLIDVYGRKYGLNTVNGIISRWAPATDGNDVRGYAASVAGRLGVNPDQPLDLSNPQVKQGLIMAMGQFENGRPIGPGAGPAAGTQTADMPQPNSAMPPNAMSFTGEPQNGFSPAKDFGPPTAAFTPAPGNAPSEAFTRAADGGMGPPPAAPPPAVAMGGPAVQPQAAPQSAPQVPGPQAAPQQAAPQQPRNPIEGFTPQAVRIIKALNNPDLPEGTRAALTQVLGKVMPADNKILTQPDGTVLSVNERTQQVTVLREGTKAQLMQIGEDMLGNKRFGIFDNNTRKVTDLAGNPITAENAGGATTIPAGPDGQPLQGPELLKHLEKTDPMTAAGIRGIIEGNINAGGRNLQKLLPVAQLVDPSLRQFDYQTRAKTSVDFTSGASSREIKAINTAIYHASQLSEVSDKLGGVNILPGVINPVLQGIQRNSGNVEYQNARKAWDATSETLATEISKALNGGQPHVGDKEAWRKIFAAAGSPAERDAAIAAGMKLLEGRTHTLATTYERGMGRSRDGMTFVDPANKAAFEQLMATGKVTGDAVPKAPGASAPAPQSTAPPDRAAVEAARANPQGALQEARDAIAAGRDRGAVIKQLREIGVNPAGL